MSYSILVSLWQKWLEGFFFSYLKLQAAYSSLKLAVCKCVQTIRTSCQNDNISSQSLETAAMILQFPQLWQQKVKAQLN